MFYRTLRLLPLEHRRKIIVTCPLQTTHSFSGGHRVISLLPLTDILHHLQGQTLQSTARNSLTTKKPLEIFPHFVRKNNQLFPILVVHSSSITRPYVPLIVCIWLFIQHCVKEGFFFVCLFFAFFYFFIPHSDLMNTEHGTLSFCPQCTGWRAPLFQGLASHHALAYSGNAVIVHCSLIYSSTDFCNQLRVRW